MTRLNWIRWKEPLYVIILRIHADTAPVEVTVSRRTVLALLLVVGGLWMALLVPPPRPPTLVERLTEATQRGCQIKQPVPGMWRVTCP